MTNKRKIELSGTLKAVATYFDNTTPGTNNVISKELEEIREYLLKDI